jgi:hypothetical protein
MPAIDPLKQIFPGWTAPVIRKAEDGECQISVLTWGFVLLQDGRAPKRVTNAGHVRGGGQLAKQRRAPR